MTKSARAILTGILVSFLAGGLAAAAHGGQEDDAPSSLLVPVGSVGDEGTYIQFDARPGHAPQPVSAVPFRVLRVAQSVDEIGTPHETLLVEYDPGEYIATSAHISLDDRQVVRRQLAGDGRTMRELDLGDTSNPATGAEGIEELIDFGPELEPSLPAATDPTTFWFQGMTIRPDLDLGDVLGPRVRNLYGLAADELQQFTATVGPLALVDGEEAVPVTLAGVALLDVRSASAGRGPEHVMFLSATVPPVGRVDFSRTLWFTATSPYPVLVEDRIQSQDGAHDAILSLDAVSGGITPIPWQSFDLALSTRQWRPERSEGALHPTQGSVRTGCLDLAQALLRLDTEAKYAPFRAWRDARGPVYLVGFQTGCQEPAYWLLSFATGTGDAYGVTLWDENPNPSPFEQRVQQTEPFDVARLPQDPVTVAHVERLWATFAPDRPLENQFTTMYWGFFRGIMPTGDYFIGYPGMVSTPALLDQIEFHVARGETDAAGRHFVNSTWLYVDVRTGELAAASRQGFYETGYFETSEQPPGDISHMSARTAFPSVAPDATPRMVAMAAAVSGTVLAAWLAVYFFPALKYAATHGFFGAGFSKLDKDGLLKNKLRDQLVTIIRSDPGVSATDIAKRVDAGWSTVVYHLGVLERNGLVTSLADTRHRRFFPAGEVHHGQRARMAVLRNDRTRFVYALVQQHPGLSQGEVAKHIGISLPGAAWHLKRLEEHQFITRAKAGRTVRLYPKDATPPARPPSSNAAAPQAL